MRWKVLGIAIFAVLIAWFTLVNSTEVTVHFLVVTAQTSLVFVILLSVLLGMCLMAVLWSLRSWKLSRANRQLRRELQNVEQDLAGVREELVGYKDAKDATSFTQTGLLTQADSATQAESLHHAESTSEAQASQSQTSSKDQTNSGFGEPQ